MDKILELTNTGMAILGVIEKLSESDIRLMGYIDNEKTCIAKSVEGIEYIGYAREQVQRLQMMGFIKSQAGGK